MIFVQTLPYQFRVWNEGGDDSVIAISNVKNFIQETEQPSLFHYFGQSAKRMLAFSELPAPQYSSCYAILF